MSGSLGPPDFSNPVLIKARTVAGSRRRVAPPGRVVRAVMVGSGRVVRVALRAGAARRVGSGR
ncbi:hypothetical protein [Micromonospora parva]|uniref:hypothetical protein n=1 Tax=Micromonospora parva TaxID=1464048 RepID=UPI00365613D3